ncbi:hypothetical protein HZB90_02780 [archaeon]|nr:hypothetical protein [archaeon]
MGHENTTKGGVFGFVFVKVRQKEADDLSHWNDLFCELERNSRPPPSCKNIAGLHARCKHACKGVHVVACAALMGQWDYCVVMHSKSIDNIGKFVLYCLRDSSRIARLVDTSTMVGLACSQIEGKRR